MPVAISAPASTTDAFQAQAYASGTPNSTNLSGTLKSILTGYCNISRLVGTSYVTVTLYWNKTTPKPLFPDNAQVVQYTTSWQSVGSTNLTSTYLQGSVSSDASLSSFGLFTLGFNGYNPGTCSTCDTLVNWANVREFDEYGRVISENRVFTDNLGRKKQTQSRNLVANRILTQATEYDTYGRPSLSTLTAPLLDTATCFNYTSNKNFIASTFAPSLPYNHKDFDSTNTLNGPNAVSSSSLLGKYYSNSNSDESTVAISSYPYTFMDYNDSIIGGVTRLSGPADSLRMGKGHEVKAITLSLAYDGEINNYLSYKNNFFSPNNLSSFNNQIVKTISIDQNGSKSITYTDKSGKTIITCMEDLSATPNSLSVTLNASYYTLELDVPSWERYDNVVINTTDSVEILNNNTSSSWFGKASSQIYPTLASGSSIFIKSNSPFFVTYNRYVSNPTGPEFFYKVRVGSYNNINDQSMSVVQTNSVDLHIQTAGGISFTEHSVTGSQVKVLNLETGAVVYNGLVSSFNSSIIKPGFYRIIYTKFSGHTNFTYSGYLTLSYSCKYSNYSFYFYDVAGRLQAVTSPNGVGTGTGYPTFTSSYTYNTLGWQLSSKDPDRGLTYYVYQKDGQLRYSQDTLQRANTRFSYINYDAQNRVIETGEYSSTVANPSYTPLYFQNTLDYYLAKAIPTGYTNAFAYVDQTDGLDDPRCNTVGKKVYDTPDNSGLSAVRTLYTQRNVNGKVAKSSNNNITYWYSYDERGRIEWTIQHLEGSAGTAFSSSIDSNRVKTIDYTYDINNNLLTVIYQKYFNEERLDHYYTYDVMQRLLRVQTQLSGGTLTEHAEYSYYLHGPLKRKELGDNLQGLDYVYTVDGKLKAINHPYLDTSDVGRDGYSGIHSGFGKDVFGMVLEYYDNDYVRGTKFQTSANLTSTGYKNYFDGTVRSWTWNQSGSASLPSQYSYTYDLKYQLTGADYGIHDTITNQFTKDINWKYKVYGITYDLNGNLISLKRRDGTGSLVTKNNISYFYNSNTNMLQQTKDSLSVNSRTYGYDVTGRMTSYTNTISDKNKYVSYDYSGKVTGIYNSSGTLQPLATFLYDEKGNRIRKTSYDASFNAISHTWYVYDAAGHELAIYNTTISSSTTVQNELYVYGTERICMINKYGSTEYDYEIKDHLGNTRVVFRKSLTGDSVEVLDYSDYYPHGGKLPGRNLISSLNPRNNCYQGEYAERDDETGYLSFDLRMYDSDIGRWISPDPQHEFHSPYLAMGNNPMTFVDPTGGKTWFGHFFGWVGEQIDSYAHSQGGNAAVSSVHKFENWTAAHGPQIAAVVATVAVAVLTDGIGDAFLAEPLGELLGSATAGEVASGALMGAAAGGFGGGIQYVAGTSKFNAHDFWSSVGVGAIAGFFGGGVAGAFDEIPENASFWESVGKGSVKGLVSGAAGGFAYGIAGGIAHGGYNLGQDLEMGLTAAFTGGGFGALAGAAEGVFHYTSDLDAERLKTQIGRKGGFKGALRAANMTKGNGVTYGKLFNAFFFSANIGGTVGTELINYSSGPLGGDGLNGRLNHWLWGIKEDEE